MPKPQTNSYPQECLSRPQIKKGKCGSLLSQNYGEVCMASAELPTAVVAKYRTSASSSCCSFSRFGRICCCMRLWPRGAGVPVCPDFSRSTSVPSAGKRRRVSIKTAYDFATLNRILGISSATSLSKIGRMEVSMILRLIAGASVYQGVSIGKKSLETMCPLTEIAKHVVIL